MSSPFACSSFRFLRREQLLMMASCLFQCKAGTGRRRSFAAAAAKAGRSARLVSSSMIALARRLLCRFRNAYAFQRKWRALPRMPKALPFRRVHACYSVSLAPAFSIPFKRMISSIAAHARKSTVETARFHVQRIPRDRWNAADLCRGLFPCMKSGRCI